MKRLILGLAILVGGGVFSATAQTPPLPEIVSVPKTAAAAASLPALGLDLLADWDGRIYIVAEPRDLALLKSRGIAFRYDTWSFAPAVPRPRGQGGPIGAFHTGLQLERDLLDLQAEYPGLAKVFNLGTSLENRPIYALKISDNVALDEDEAETLFLGCHHAREWISVDVPLRLARRLAEGYASNPDIRRRVDASEIWIVPLVNPDGLEYTIQTYRWWRKNRRANADGSFGVDLNRNYGYMWGIDDEGSSPAPSSEIYRGTGPFSEPETRIVHDLCRARSFLAVVSYHSFGQLILYPWGWTARPSPRHAADHALAARMAALIRVVNGQEYVPESASTLYLTNGDTIDYVAGTLGIPAFTIELPPLDLSAGGFMNAEKDIASVSAENLPAMLFLIDDARNRHVPSGNPAEPERPDGPPKGRSPARRE